MRLGCGFRQPNSETEFVASVIGIGPYALRGTARRGRRALRVVAESRRDCPGQRRTAKRLHCGREEMGGNCSRDHPQRGHQPRTIPQSRPLAVPAPFAQGSLWGRGMRIAVTSAPNFGTKFGWRWLRHRCVGPAGLLAMTMDFCHSEERSDVGIRPFYGGRGFGPPYLGHGLRRPNFVPKFGASVRSSAPTESPINHPSQPARSEASAPADARDGRESAQRPSQKGGDRPATAGAALSEAESAERAAGQIRSLPDGLRVQHGAEGSEVSARPRPCSR